VPTAGRETTKTLEDANSRGAKTGGNIINRKYINYRRDASNRRDDNNSRDANSTRDVRNNGKANFRRDANSSRGDA